MTSGSNGWRSSRRATFLARTLQPTSVVNFVRCCCSGSVRTRSTAFYVTTPETCRKDSTTQAYALLVARPIHYNCALKLASTASEQSRMRSASAVRSQRISAIRHWRRSVYLPSSQRFPDYRPMPSSKTCRRDGTQCTTWCSVCRNKRRLSSATHRSTTYQQRRRSFSGAYSRRWSPYWLRLKKSRSTSAVLNRPWLTSYLS